MTQVENLYNYRVTDANKVTTAHPTRRRAAKKAQSLINNGHSPESLVLESREKGQWFHDGEIYKLAQKYIAAANASGSSKVKEMTLSKALRQLANVAKLAASADELSQDHINALNDSMGLVARFINFDPDEEDEEDETADEEGETAEV